MVSLQLHGGSPSDGEWEECRESCGVSKGITTIARESKALLEVGLQAWRMREDSLMEAKELFRETESFYCAAIEGVKEKQLVLSYMGIPLLKVSRWT
ncbi:hypothetical protein D5086_002533 [Populus alba]|uniref:Uncharacterized protein n=1 Tax=Populus alba TaxID=43335 RepID=A0ACC4D1T3_POPAL